MKFDVAGRMRNMRLPDGKAAILYSVYEAVSNSLHAIEERFGASDFGEKGIVKVNVQTDDDGNVSSLSIQDNGIGLTSDNLEAFDTCDSRRKLDRGGKGIGRLVWFKVFQNVYVESRCTEKGKTRGISFRFAPENIKSIQNVKDDAPSDLEIGTRIILSDPYDNSSLRMLKVSFLRDLALHFFSYYVAGSMPEISILFNDSTEKLGDFIENKISPVSRVYLDLQLDESSHKISVSHMFVDSTISKELKNSLLFTAHNRLVGDPLQIERKFALNELPDRTAYVGVVRADPRSC